MRFLAAFSALMLFIGVAKADMLSPRAFTEAVAQAVRAATPSATVTVTGDLQLEIKIPNGAGTLWSDLRNAYGQYRETPEHLKDVIRTYVSALSPSEVASVTRAVDRSHIVPVIKNKK